MTKRHKQRLTDQQRAARQKLSEVARGYPASLAIVAGPTLGEDGFDRTIIRLPTGELSKGPDGLDVNAFEDVVVGVGPAFPLRPPTASVQHDRFAGHCHVLQGDRVCVYLDPSREWHPSEGIPGFLEQLWKWFEDAVGGRFDPAVALYHPVGGVLHQSEGTPTVVIREALPTVSGPFTRARLTRRTDARLDLSWDGSPKPDTILASVVAVPVPLRYGAGMTLLNLLAAIGLAGHPTPEGVLRAFGATASRNQEGSPLYFVLAVPNRAGAYHHLVVGRVPPEPTAVLRRAGSVQGINPASVPPDIPIEWCAVSDERPEITTRRDEDRPVNAFAGKTVHVWGCGGLGSWMAEFIARAGVRELVVCDPGDVGGGLLVRQNYAENDVGLNKAEALAARLRAVRDRLTVRASTGLVSDGDSDELLPKADLLIDATVSVAMGVLLDAAARQHVGDRPVIGQVATDTRSGTLGILTVAASDYPAGPATIDADVGQRVLADGTVERFHPFWQEPTRGDEIIPARGCSVPTFHGSAADMASVAGVLSSLLGPHLGGPSSGTHLIALPHAVRGPAHRFLPASD